MAPSNNAACLVANKVRPLKVQPVKYTSPRHDEIVVRNRAVAINPIDWIVQTQGTFAFGWIEFPFVLGSDVAGEVAEVGESVTRFKVGDRVAGHAVGIDKKRNSAAEGAFQEYTVMLSDLITHIPDHVPFSKACVIPLALATAAAGLFNKGQLELQLPSSSPKPQDRTLLIWGGSTSVGTMAIQLAANAGYEVFATASPRNFQLLKSLGASQVFDYNSKTVGMEIVAAMKGKTTAGALSMSAGAVDSCTEVLKHCKGNKFVSRASFPLPSPLPKRFVLLNMASYFISWTISNFFNSRRAGVSYNFVTSLDSIENGIGKAMYEGFLPGALATGSFVPAPEPQIVGHGLENIQHALDVQKQGVSAKKVVVTL